MSSGSSSSGSSSTTQRKVESLMNLIHQRVGKLSHTENKWSICKVPSRLRELNKDAYTPRIVSIGPIHSGQENLQDMEVHKTRYMQSLFSRTRKDYDLILSEFAEAILSMEKKPRSCYYDYSTQLSNSRSLEVILLLDGCFLLELFLRWHFTGIRGDPIFGASTIPSIRRDLTLLENQIPFFVLERLYEIILPGNEKPHPLSLTQLCASFFYIEWNLEQPNAGCRHLLDLIRKCYVPRPSLNPSLKCEHCSYLDWQDHMMSVFTFLKIAKKNIVKIAKKTIVWSCQRHIGAAGGTAEELETEDPEASSGAAGGVAAQLAAEDPEASGGAARPRTEQRRKKNYELIHCVSKLRESGIKFEKGSSKNLFDIKFIKGVLEIPKLRIDDTMDSLLRNMIAFEQCDHSTSYHITSYAVLMDYLIDSPADVEFLQHKRIIENYLGHGEEVSKIFNKISNKVFVEDFYFDTLCHQVNEYSDKWWPRRRESLVRGYCFNLWKVIGLIAGSILLVFAGLQTGYTMASYHHPPK